MGCGTSRERYPSARKQRSVYNKELCLTERQREQIRDSWGIIQKDMLVTGLEIYANFLRNLETEILHLFPKIIQTDENNEKLIVHEENLQHHVMVVMKGIGKVVCNLNDLSVVQGFLSYVGQRHVQSHVKPYMLEKLWPSIDDSFRVVLQDVYTNEVRDSWKCVMDYMIDKIQENMSEAENSQNFEMTTDTSYSEELKYSPL